jgi:hypothetical protein
MITGTIYLSVRNYSYLVKELIVFMSIITHEMLHVGMNKNNLNTTLIFFLNALKRKLLGIYSKNILTLHTQLYP